MTWTPWCRVVASGAVSYVEQCLDAFARLPEGDLRAMSGEDRAALRAHLPVVARWAGELGAHD